MADYASDVPSKQQVLLVGVVGQRLLRLVRYSWWPAEQVSLEHGRTPRDVFGRTAGPLALEFESGCVLGAASDPSQNSVIVWLERDVSGATRGEPMADDPELSPIGADDAHYSTERWAAVCGERVSSISILQRTGQGVMFEDLPNEACIRIDLEHGESIVLAHGLHDDSDDFSVLHLDEVLPEIAPMLHVRWTSGGTN